MSHPTSDLAYRDETGPNAPARGVPSGSGVGRGFMTALVVASILNPLNTSSLATALVAIGADLHATAAELGMLVAAVYITSAVAQPVMGTLSVRWGARRVLLAGLALVAAAGVVGGTAAGIPGLLGARVLIGLGTSSAVPAALVMLRRRAERIGMGTPTREIAALTAAGNVMAAAGLPLGGVLVQAFGWRSVFWVNTPLALLALGLALVFLHAGDDARGSDARAPQLDWAGVGLFTAAIVALAVFLNDVESPLWAALGIALLAAAALAWWERRVAARAAEPFIDFGLIRSSRPLRGVYVRSFWLSTAVYCTLYALAQWLGTRHGMSSSQVGLLMLPQSVLAALAAVWAGRRAQVRPFILGAGALLLVAAATLAAASLLPGTASVAVAVLTTVATGIAFGIGMVGNQTALYLASTTEQFGVASGLLRTASYVGGFVAMAVMGVLYAGGATDAGLRGFVVVFVLAGVITLGNARGSIPEVSADPRTTH